MPDVEPGPRPFTASRVDEHILRLDWAAGSAATLADAEATAAVLGELSGGRPYALLVDIRQAGSIERAARQKFAQPSGETAVALIVESPLSRMMANFFMGLNRPPFPVRVFSDEPSALAWLRANAG